MLYSRLVIVIFVLFKSACCEAKVTLPPNIIVKAVYAFGDSILDQGMNNNLKTNVKANAPPYGMDFIGGIPTGRFTNDRNPPDMIAAELGIKELLPAYLAPNLNAEDLKTGVSFASGGSGYDPRTSTTNGVIALSTQLIFFKEYIEKLKELVGEEEATFILNNSIFILCAGSVDLAGLTGSYFADPIRQHLYDIDSYTTLLTSYATAFVQELYKLGARNTVILGVPSVGCLPAQRTIFGGLTRNCSEKTNQAAQLTNVKFSAGADSVQKLYPQYKLVYIDTYNTLLDCIANPNEYGLEQVEKGCCGTGTIEVGIFCNKLSGVCEDDTKYLFWDGFHLTDKGYTILVNQIIKAYINSIA